MNSSNKCKAVYILGHSRSGSTILNILLGNIESVFAAGEINNYLKSGWVNDHYCSCGSPISQCEFWPKVKESLESTIDPDPESLVRTSKQLENWRNLIKSGFSKNKERDIALKHYIDFNSALIKSIARFSESDWIVDASKSPTRLSLLLDANDLDFKVIHIIRDPRGVCWSLYKSAAKNIEAGVQTDLPSTPYIVTIKDLYINAFMSFLAKRKIPSKHTSIRYDDLLNSTTETIERLGELLEIDVTDLVTTTESNQPLQQKHNVAGNRLRMKSNITLKNDQSWKLELPYAKYLAITVLTFPLLLIYKFPMSRKQ